MNTTQPTNDSPCPHAQVACINQYELVRKYRCDACSGVMMCACNEAFGRRFLNHQLSSGRELETQVHVPVGLGFVANVCPECRGFPPVTAPVAATFGRTSKIKRYYWRELFFLTTQRQADWVEANPDASTEAKRAAHAAIEAEVLEEIKAGHAAAPKYVFSEVSQAEILKQCNVDVQAIGAAYADQPTKGAVIQLGDEAVSPEAFVTRMYEAQGWTCLRLESAPFHALFGVMMWLLIQDGADERARMAGFGDRHAYEAREKTTAIWTRLPDDFGGPGYAARRQIQIAEHFDLFPDDLDELLWLFDYWRPHSTNLCQYLWAHRDADVERARRLIEILSPEQTASILRYLIADYWNHYLGWPDLLLQREDEVLFVEVKSSSDRLSEDQKRWIVDNHEQLKLPFRLVKLHRKKA